ncbi:MAG: hypothetical protein WBA67_16700 [Jannaschia sp.]
MNPPLRQIATDLILWAGKFDNTGNNGLVSSLRRGHSALLQAANRIDELEKQLAEISALAEAEADRAIQFQHGDV